MENIINIIVADDHKLFRSGLIDILRANSGFNIVAEAENGKELISKCTELKPDLLLIDISMPMMSGLEALKHIREVNTDVKALFISMYDSNEYVHAVLNSGGDGLLNKNVEKEEVYNAIMKIMSGEKYFQGYNLDKITIMEDNTSGVGQALVFNKDELTRRELKILNFISEGRTSIEIAKELRIGKRTVDTHRTNLIKKLKLHSLPDLVRFAIQFSLLNKQN